MRAAANPPWSLFIVQAWMEGADPKSFRARIKQISHLGSTTVVSATSSPAELGEKAKGWAEEFIAAHT